MTQPKSSTGTGTPKPAPAAKRPPPSAKDALARRKPDAERYTVKPEFWDGILDSLPPWGDEIAAILLIVFGIVSFLSLLNVSSDATISTAWSRALTSLFGYGNVVVSAGILALGVIILLPKLGVVIRFPTRRILAIEVAFLSLMALLHLAAGDPELRALARAGQGGGQLGWALSTVLVSLFGTLFAVGVYGLLFGVSMGMIAGFNSEHVRRWLHRATATLTRISLDMATAAADVRERRKPPLPPPDVLGAALQTIDPPARKTLPNPIMRIRPDLDSIPPSVRQALAAAERHKDDDAPAIDPASHPLFQKRDHLSKTVEETIGKVKSESTGGSRAKKTTHDKTAPIMVERPDGRMKRYFTVTDLKEPKYVGKRNPLLPPLDLLRDVELYLPDEVEINRNVLLIENTLLEFDIDVDVVDVKIGPTVTQYAVQPFRETQGEAGETVTSRTRVSKIAALASDLALSMSAKRLRIEAPVPGHTYVGIEVPNKNPSVVALRSVMESRAYYEEAQKNHSPLLIPLGRDVSGAPLMIDIAAMPHLLIAGTTGSGKSVCMAAVATALILANTPDVCKLVMLDPKMVELSRFNGIPHLLGPVETDQERIIGVLRWCTREMDRRYRVLEENNVRNVEAFNASLGKRRKDEFLPYIVIMIDEIGDLMLQRPDETEQTITRLAQKARAAGMHLIVATQRPSVDVITGLIKANFPSRISFAVASGVDSRVILDSIGAESLMGRGDMLYQSADAAGPRRVQGCFVSDDEVRLVVEWWRRSYQEQIQEGKAESVGIGPWERGLTRREFLSETDPMLEQAISLVIAEGEASASLIQRRLGLGYPRAARIMDLLVELGIVGDPKPGGRSREVRIKPGQDPFKDLIEKKLKTR